MSDYFINFPGNALFFGIPLALGGVIVLFYFLKLRRSRKVISSTFLWRKSVEDLRVNAPFQKLRKNILLLLQILILLALIFAFYRPWIRGTRMQGRSVVILVDHSASMGAEVRGSTRLELAKDKALALIDSIAGEEAEREVMIISFSNRAGIASNFSSDAASLKKALASIKQTDTPTSVQDAIESAAALVSDRFDAEIYIISDGAFPELRRPKKLAAAINFIPVGGNASNVALTAMDVRRSQEQLDEYQAFVTVENFSSVPFKGSVDIYFEERLIDSRAVDIPPGGMQSKIFGDYNLTEGVMKASINVPPDFPDALAADNTVHHVVKRGRKFNVLIVTPGGANFVLLEKVFTADKLTVVRRATLDAYTGEIEPGGLADYDLTVFDGVAPARVGPGNYVFINAPLPLDGFNASGTTAETAIIYNNNTHPIMNKLTIENLNIYSMIKASFPRHAVTLVESTGGPLISTVFDKDTRIIYLGFDPSKSHWPFKPSYVMFFTNTLRYLAELSRNRDSKKISAGDPITLYAPLDAEKITVEFPGGARKTLSVSDDRRADFADTDKVGLYRYGKQGAEELDEVFSVNLMDISESRLAVRRSFRMGSEEVKSAAMQVQSNTEIWKYLALFALAVLLLEWYVYNRKVRI